MFKAMSNGQYQVQHEVNTRNRSLAVSNYHRLDLTQHAVSFAGPKVWNSIPEYLRSIDKLGRFKSSIKKYFIENY